MKKIIIAIIAIASMAVAGEYSVNVAVPVKTEVVITNVVESVTATTFVFERFTANVSAPEPTFAIHGKYKDARGNVVQRKIIPVSLEQARQIMPDIDTVMSNATVSVASNIGALLAE